VKKKTKNGKTREIQLIPIGSPPLLKRDTLSYLLFK